MLHSNAKSVILEMANNWDYHVRLSSYTLLKVSFSLIYNNSGNHNCVTSICKFLKAMILLHGIVLPLRCLQYLEVESPRKRMQTHEYSILYMERLFH